MFTSIIKSLAFLILFYPLFLSTDEVDAWLDEGSETKQTAESASKEELPPEVQEELERMFRKEQQPPNKDVNIHASVLIITGDGGSGSGFKVKFGDLPMIVSNAHVILGIRNPVIKDLEGRIYKPERIYASKTRDLVLIKYLYENNNDKDLLHIVPLFDRFKIGMPVTAYGNSLGGGVITELKGKLIATGPERIEVTAEIVPGNSGGPIISDTTKEVFGIATSIQILDWSEELIGTRYESNWLKVAIRRFAVRIDNLTAADLEVLSFDDYQKDQKSSLAVEAFYRRVRKILNSSGNIAAKKGKLKKLCTRFVPILEKLDAYQWKSSYLQQEYARKREEIGTFFKSLRMDDELLAAKIRKIWDSAEVKVKKIHIRGKTVNCKRCRGTGLVSDEKDNGEYERKFSKRLEVTSVGKKCPVCNGTRLMKISDDIDGEQYILHKETKNALEKLIEPDKKPFNGFTIGGTLEDEYRRFDDYYTRERLLQRSPTPFGAFLVYEGNHQMKNVSMTAMRFSLGRLTQILVTIPDEGNNYRLARQYVGENFTNENARYTVSILRDNGKIFIRCDHKVLPILLKLPGPSNRGLAL